MPRPIVAGLDIGSSAIRVVVAEAGRDNRAPRILAQARKESHGVRRGYIINFDETLVNVRDCIAEAERQARVKIRSVFLGVGGISLESRLSEGSVVVSTGDQEVSGNDLARASETSERNLTDFANRRIIHALPVGYKIDGKKVLGHPEGMKGSKLEVRTLFIHILNQHLQDFVRIVESVGLSIDDVIASPVAASIPTLTATQKAAGCLLANIGSQTTSLVTFEEGIPVSLQVLPIGSNDVTNDIALGMRVPLDEAEKIKLDPETAFNQKRKLDEIIEARLSDTLELIDTHLKKIGRNGLLPAGIVIVGGGANELHLEALAKTTLKLPAKIFDPSRDGPFRSGLKDSGWMVAYGLCLYGLDSEAKESLQTRIKATGNRLLRWFKEFWP